MPIDAAERERRRRLMQAHVDAENAHDLPAIMATFAENAELVFNHTSAYGLDAIARGHASIGFSNEPGIFENLRGMLIKEYFTEQEIVVEGLLVGKFVRPFGSFPPTNIEVRVPFINAYRFDAAGKLVHERAVLNLGALDPQAP
jgi:hypothetical protein